MYIEMWIIVVIVYFLGLFTPTILKKIEENLNPPDEE